MLNGEARGALRFSRSRLGKGQGMTGGGNDRPAHGQRPAMAMVRLVWCGLVWWGLCGGLAAQQPGPSAPQRLEELEKRVAQLIQQLGDPEFARRERAQSELEQIGLDAFDALREAMTHDDIEVAWRARYLVRRLQLRWISEQDPPHIRKLLSDYSRSADAERRSRIDHLALLPDGQGLAALCRIVRFETDVRIAKYAALQLLRHADPGAGSERLARAELLASHLGTSRQPAAHWVRLFVRELSDHQDHDAEWLQLIQDEQHTLATLPDRTSAELVRGLIQWRVERWVAEDKRSLAGPLLEPMLALVPNRPDQLKETVDWLIKNEFLNQVPVLAERFHNVFEENLVLVYRLAEVYRRQGDAAKAEQLAEKARNTLVDQHEQHLEAAWQLEERGHFDWAEREFLQVIESATEGSLANLRARFALAEMYHDQLRNLEAAKTLEPVVDAARSSPEFANRVRNARGGGEPEEVAARMHFFYAEHFASQDRDQQRQHLLKGIEAFPQEIDLLIAMYHFPEADDQWMQKTRARIQETLNYYREQIRLMTDRMQQNLEPSLEDTFRAYLARLHNQLAWLIANTEGDFDEALRSSRLSLEYRPNTAAYLDTLGRCYYAKKDYENAVKYQRQALQLEPYSGQMRRQLELFEKALAESRQSASESSR
ncbi:MAG: hypothetical protein KatS3mg110_4247 [Pirellulaceae bacterium]|nr:MAG: hypothetical protein KatS3mg110_4247 [Pirellulaceae bacterium]